MKNIFSPGDVKVYTHTVTEADAAAFKTGEVHPVYSTFALGRDAEWACRQFVLEMKEEEEEGIGTYLSVEHLSPALIGDIVTITARVKSIERNEIICTYEATTGGRLVARGEQGQKILKKEKIDRLFSSLRNKKEV